MDVYSGSHLTTYVIPDCRSFVIVTKSFTWRSINL